MSDEHISQTQIEREVEQALARSKELRKQAADRRKRQRRLSFLLVALILTLYALFLILYPR